MIATLKSNNKIIINSDIDGVLSGLILQHFLGCKVVGFCNSDNKLWISRNELSNYSKIVYIDMFVNNPKTTCIDQHIVSFNEAHNEIIKNQKNKFNPNVIRGRYFYPKTSYYAKYPFGTVHFIIAELEKQGLDLQEIKLISDTSDISPIDFFLRADDALLTSVHRYQENAKDWWNWLLAYSSYGKITQQFIEYVYADIDAFEIKHKVEKLLQGSPYCCDRRDGGFLEILGNNGELLSNFRHYLDFIADAINLKILDISENFKTFEGISKRIKFKQHHYKEFSDSSTVLGNKVFSYAFVKSYGQEKSFSFTYFPKKE